MGLRPPKRNLLQLENPDGSKATMRIQVQVQKKVVPLVHPPRHRRKKKIPPIINAGQPEMFHITSKNMTTRSRLLWPKRKRSRLNTQQLQLRKPGLLVKNPGLLVRNPGRLVKNPGKPLEKVWMTTTMRTKMIRNLTPKTEKEMLTGQGRGKDMGNHSDEDEEKEKKDKEED